MQYTYPITLLASSTKPLEIKVGATKIGYIQAYYPTIFVRIFDHIGSSPPVFIRYRLYDNDGVERIHAKQSGFLKNKKIIRYLDNNQKIHQIIMEDTKVYDGFGEKGVEVTFEGKKYSLSRKFLEAAELHLEDELIADWRIQVSAKRVVVNIYENDHSKHEFLILGIFHSWFYASKG